MKFEHGTDTDRTFCESIHHEFLRCHDAFIEFHAFATLTVTNGPDRQLSYMAYNTYSRFIHHLYEFLLAAYCRERGDTKATAKRGSQLQTDAYINHHAQRVLRNKRAAIQNGTAPKWENSLSAYAEKIPEDLAQSFRLWRNKAYGHVSAERPRMDLSRFFQHYHQYLHMLYRDSMYQWGPKEGAFPDLQEITGFSIQ
jgi:hypothetical protein